MPRRRHSASGKAATSCSPSRTASTRSFAAAQRCRNDATSHACDSWAPQAGPAPRPFRAQRFEFGEIAEHGYLEITRRGDVATTCKAVAAFQRRAARSRCAAQCVARSACRDATALRGMNVARAAARSASSNCRRASEHEAIVQHEIDLAALQAHEPGSARHNRSIIATRRASWVACGRRVSRTPS